MEQNKMYKHIKCHDVSFYIASIISNTNDKLVLKGKWFHTFHKFFIADDEIEIKKEDIGNWNEIT